MTTTKKIILIDLDDTANMFSEILEQKIKTIHPEIADYPLEKRPIYEVERYYPSHCNETIIKIVGARGFILGLDPKPGFVDAVHKLKERYDIIFCSSPTKINPELSSYEKHLWLKKYFGNSDNLILTRDKTLIYGDYLIDDKPHIDGLVSPNWKRIIFDQPYNRTISSDLRCKDWSEVLLFFENE